MTFALFVNGVAEQLFDADPELHPSLDVRDVSRVRGFAIGWRVKGDGEYEPPLAAEPLPLGPSLAITFKADLWRRATDEEAAQMDTALMALPVRLRRMYEDSQHISHTDEYFSALADGLVKMFGDARSSELLAVSV